MDIKLFKEKLKQYKKEDIIITHHAEIQAVVRNIDIDEVKNNIVNPERLAYVSQQGLSDSREDKYDCYFAYSKHHCHRYIIALNRKVIIVTIININRDWQKIIEGRKR